MNGRDVIAAAGVLHATNGGLTRRMTLRPIQAAKPISRGLQTPIVRFSAKITSDHDIACKTLPYVFARLGLYIHNLPPSGERGDLRSITPPGFARAVFEANLGRCVP